MRNKLLTIAVLGGLVGMLGSAGMVAAGEDGKTYPGFICQQDGNDTGAFNRSAYRITRTGSTGGAAILCPVVRDIVDPSGGVLGGYIPALKAEVSTYRTPDSGDLSCTLYRRNYGGTSVSYDTKYALPYADVIKLSTGADGNRGYYHLQCSMPVNTATTYAKIYAYTVTENEG